ncbi:MAG: hypothetical protein M5U12_13750 [Verrucomicrobia bacterium]|nr:hypothetical protein [Verrucomicrobiota bacterium]
MSTVAEVLQLPAVAVNADGSARANQVQVHGVDARFWALAPDPPRVGPLPADALLLNRALAGQLRAGPGDTVLLRVRKPQALSADAPLAPEEDTTVALRLRVQAVLEDREFGRFGLAASQVAPFNAFVSLPLLQTRLGATNRANLLLAGQVPVAQPAPPGATIVPGMNPGLRVGLPPLDLRLHLDRVLTQRWQLADAQIDWVALPRRRDDRASQSPRLPGCSHQRRRLRPARVDERARQPVAQRAPGRHRRRRADVLRE